MVKAAIRWVALAALLGGPPARARPAPPAVERFERVDYVSAIDAAEQMGLRLSWRAAGRQLALSDRSHRIDLEAESREAVVDGLRVYLGNPVVARGGRLYVRRSDYERRLVPLACPGLCGPPPRPVSVIAVDPGHGGVDHGAENPRLGLMEKTFTLDVGLRLRKLLEDAGYKVVLTRATDTKVELPIRALIANQAGADLFVSIHFNSLARDTRTHGTEVYTFPLSGQRSDEAWGGRENDGEPSASPVNRFDCWSAILAQSLHRSVLQALRTEDRGGKTKHLAALRSLDCPAALVESAYLSNDAEAQRVATPAFRQQVAEALLGGIRAYAAALDRLRPAGEPGQGARTDSPAKGPPPAGDPPPRAASLAHPTRPASP